jgi:hypothetical protein
VRHERPRWEAAPLSPIGRYELKALLVGLCALFLVTQAAAAASGAEGSRKAPSAEREDRPVSIDRRLEQKLATARRFRGTIRFFHTHRSLLSSGEQRAVAREALSNAQRRLARATKEIAYYRRLIRQRDARLAAHRLAKAPPRVVIQEVFGRYAAQAVNVAWCESRLATTARNGQYLGLFQMGSSERRLFGHGHTAHEQALAAHRYFVRSGRDWSPWSCRWAAS